LQASYAVVKGSGIDVEELVVIEIQEIPELPQYPGRNFPVHTPS
jgi:hypothetical protein